MEMKIAFALRRAAALSMVFAASCDTGAPETPPIASSDHAIECADGHIQCGVECIDPSSDVTHCGGCNAACGAGMSCAESECRTPEFDDIFAEFIETRCGPDVAPLNQSELERVVAWIDAGSQLCADDQKQCGTSCCNLGEACQDDACVPAPAFEDVHADILKPRCAPCHTLMSKGTLSLKTADKAFDNMVHVPADPAGPCAGRVRVQPGDVEGSLLFHKVAGGDDLCGERMPKNVFLSDDDIETLSLWIMGGALRD